MRSLVFYRRLLIVMALLPFAAAAEQDLEDPFLGEALYHAYQGEYFEALERLDSELAQRASASRPEACSVTRDAPSALRKPAHNDCAGSLSRTTARHCSRVVGTPPGGRRVRDFHIVITANPRSQPPVSDRRDRNGSVPSGRRIE